MSQRRGPRCRRADMRKLRREIAHDPVTLFEAEFKNAERVLAHFLAREKFLLPLAEIEARLEVPVVEVHFEIVAGEKQPALPVRSTR